MKFLKKIFNMFKIQRVEKKDLALRLQAEMLVLRSLVMRSSLFLLAKEPDLIKAVKYSCLDEIQNLELSGANSEDQKKFILYAETALEDMFARVRVNNQSLETLN